MVGLLNPMDTGDMVSGIPSRIEASHDEVRRETLKTIEAHQPQESPDTHLQAVNINQGVVSEQPESPKTINACVPGQDQDKIITMHADHDQEIQQAVSNSSETFIHQDGQIIVTEPNESPMTVTACVPGRDYGINMLQDESDILPNTEKIPNTRVKEASHSPKTLNACCPRQTCINMHHCTMASSGKLRRRSKLLPTVIILK